MKLIYSFRFLKFQWKEVVKIIMPTGKTNVCYAQRVNIIQTLSSSESKLNLVQGLDEIMGKRGAENHYGNVSLRHANAPLPCN